MKAESAQDSLVRGEILHVDDDPLVLAAFAALLENESYAVASVTGGAAAMQWVAAGHAPDVLVVDFNLDDELDGAELAQQLRRQLRFSPPVILLTADPEHAEVPWITDAPIWLARKPIDARLLRAALPGLVQMSRAMRAVIDSPQLVRL